MNKKKFDPSPKYATAGANKDLHLIRFWTKWLKSIYDNRWERMVDSDIALSRVRERHVLLFEVHARSRDFSTAVGDPPAAWILNSGLPAGF
jgi:hypothetical protein